MRTVNFKGGLTGAAIMLAAGNPGSSLAQTTTPLDTRISLPACELMPRIIVGAPSASLNPIINHGKNLVGLGPNQRPTPVGLEIFPHVGFGLDGERLIIEHGAPSMTIVGHQTLAPFPQRNFQVVADGDVTRVLNVFPANGHEMRRIDDELAVISPKPHFSHQVHVQNGQLVLEGELPVQGYRVGLDNGAIRVQNASEVHSSIVSCPQSGHILLAGIPSRTWDVTRIADGLHFEGQRAIYNFDVHIRQNGFTIVGHYPQQTYDVTLQ